MNPLDLLICFGKFLGGAKALKNVGDFVTEDREAKRKERERREKEKRARDEAERFEKRNFFEALLMYVFAGAAGSFCISLGIAGIVITILFFIVHLSELMEIRKYTSILREIILTAILGVAFLVIIF